MLLMSLINNEDKRRRQSELAREGCLNKQKENLWEKNETSLTLTLEEMYFKLEIEKQTTIKTLVSNLGEQQI